MDRPIESAVRGKARSIVAPVFDALASIRLAVVTMALLGVTCAWATIVESRRGTAAAQGEFYRTWWFSLMLGVLAANILLSMLKRYPWKRHHAGFVIAHLGILSLLAGSLVSLRYGLDSHMALYDGDTTDRVERVDKAVQVVLPGHAVHATLPADFERNPPSPGREQRFGIDGSDATLVAEDFLPPAKDQRRMPAVKVRLEGAFGRTVSEWLPWGASRSLATPWGAATLAYRYPELQVPFRVTLLKFRSEKYPGSTMAATYESWVRVEDPERGVSEHHISMNNPLHYRGYVFFQASFVEGAPMMSIFSVTRAPGLPLVYLGVALISGGVAWMFYLKPYLARRQAAQALEVRQPAARHGALLGAPARSRA